jgi:hypothetical protein
MLKVEILPVKRSSGAALTFRSDAQSVVMVDSARRHGNHARRRTALACEPGDHRYGWLLDFCA